MLTRVVARRLAFIGLLSAAHYGDIKLANILSLKRRTMPRSSVDRDLRTTLTVTQTSGRSRARRPESAGAVMRHTAEQPVRPPCSVSGFLPRTGWLEATDRLPG